MWCEDINDKYRELAAGSPWWFHATGNETITREKTSPRDQRVPAQMSTTRQADLTLQLLVAFYARPDDFTSERRGEDEACEWAEPWFHPVAAPQVRAWMLQNFAGSQVFVGYLQRNVLPANLVGPLSGLAVRILQTPNGAGHATTDAGQGVVTALCNVILKTKTIDAVVWPMLWIWAFGGPTGKALIRTRSSAVQALGAIAQRNPQLVGGAQAARSVAALSESIQRGSPPQSFADTKERQTFAIAASLAAGSIAAAGAPVDPALLSPNAYLAPGTPPGDGSAVVWLPILGAIGAASLLAGVVLLFSSGTRRQSRVVGWPRARSAA